MTKIIFDLETTGLNSFEDRILCVTIYNTETKIHDTFIGESEHVVLTLFSNYLKEVTTPELIGYNVYSFDIPFLIRRILINNVSFSINLHAIKIFDLRTLANGIEVSGNVYEKGTLRDWAKMLDITVDTANGVRMKEYFETRQWALIKEHCMEDVNITVELFNLLVRCNQL